MELRVEAKTALKAADERSETVACCLVWKTPGQSGRLGV
jgi:hypothetical protein